MDPLAILANIVKLGITLREKVKQVDANREALISLHQRIFQIVQQLQQLRQFPEENQSLNQALQLLEECLNDSLQLVQKSTTTHMLIELAEASSITEAINKTNEKIDRAIQMLQISLSIQMHLDSIRKDELKLNDQQRAVFMCGSLISAVFLFQGNRIFQQAELNYIHLSVHFDTLGIKYAGIDSINLHHTEEFQRMMNEKVADISFRFKEYQHYQHMGAKVTEYLMLKFAQIPHDIKAEIRKTALEAVYIDKIDDQQKSAIVNLIDQCQSEAKISETLREIADTLFTPPNKLVLTGEHDKKTGTGSLVTFNSSKNVGSQHAFFSQSKTNDNPHSPDNATAERSTRGRRCCIL